MRFVCLIAVCGACATSPEAPLSSATFSPNPMVHSVRAQQGVVSYGAPYHKWTLTFATVEGCTGDMIGSIELDTLASVTAVPMGATPLRIDQNTVDAVPSGFLSYMGGTLVSGSVTVDTAAEGFTTGSFTAQMMVAGAATDVSGTFSAPTCP